MKKYLVSIIVLFGLLVGIVAFASTIEEKSKILEEKLMTEMTTFNKYSKNYDTKVAQNKKKMKMFSTIKDFNLKWESHMKSEGILTDVEKLSFKHTIAISQKSIQERSDYPLNGNNMAVQIIKIKLSGQYGRIFNWLSEIEQKYPQSRIEEAIFNIETGKTTLQAKLVLPKTL